MNRAKDWLTRCATRRFVLFAFEVPAMVGILFVALIWRGVL